MLYYTDIAAELYGSRCKNIPKGVKISKSICGGIPLTRVEIMRDGLNRERGTYITLEIPQIASSLSTRQISAAAIAQQIYTLLPKQGNVLAIGVGNRAVVADSLGPATAERILATRKLLSADIPLRIVSVIAPGVPATTGIELPELIQALIARLHFAAIICVDSLCTADIKRLGTNVQISSSGIVPHNGKSLCEKALGVPVIAVGIPTVMQKHTDKNGYTAPALTPTNIDAITQGGAEMLALAINKALQNNLSISELHYITS